MIYSMHSTYLQPMGRNLMMAILGAMTNYEGGIDLVYRKVAFIITTPRNHLPSVWQPQETHSPTHSVLFSTPLTAL